MHTLPRLDHEYGLYLERFWQKIPELVVLEFMAKHLYRYPLYGTQTVTDSIFSQTADVTSEKRCN